MKQRQINFELLRIVAMLMVLGLHANFLALKSPEAESILTGEGLFRTFLQSCCIVAVNVFVMISGWFGIKPSIRGFCNFMWQVVYVVGLLWIIGVLFINQSVCLKSIASIFGLYEGGGWFVASYIGLYIISPVLNAYVEKTPPRTIALMVVAFFAFEFLWGNTFSVKFIVGGYSTFSFIGIYILSGLLRKIHTRYNNALPYFCIFFTAISLNALFYICVTYSDAIAVRSIIFNYINPFVILASASLLLAFAKLNTFFSNLSLKLPILQTFVLWNASSCFAAYLLHVGTHNVLDLFCDGSKKLYSMYSGFTSFVAIAGYILAVFLLAVIIDQPRKLIYNKFIAPFFRSHVSNNQ